ncbi:PRC-barrel domain-containing protein [Euzebya tangerina]|uniref:PRC-barrel domain-containing protein n=1 Tax=Euzebya tangerina TaxID=591198 RepID=UPI000E31D297|nr:PRC-barrel domain-containing protein [Euzebya tangerina]
MTEDTRLLRHASEVTGQPVVTLRGEDVAQVRDVVFTPEGSVEGFTLAGRGLFSGPKKEWLPWSGVHGFGPDAIMIDSAERLVAQEKAQKKAVKGDVTGDEVLTRSGKVIGQVVDAVLRLEPDGELDVVGYEVEPPDGGDVRFVPLPDTLAVNEGRLMVPDEALDFISKDLSGFGASVDTFRAMLQGGAGGASS